MRTLTALLATLVATIIFVPAASAQTVCGSATPNWQCPPQSEFHQSYGPNTTYFNIGNAEARAATWTNFEGVSPNWWSWTGTVYSYRVTNTHVVAAIYRYDPASGQACRSSWDAYGTNSLNQGMYGHTEFCWKYR